MKKRGMSNKGISTLVATVLLVLITIAAIGLIWAGILPLIQKPLTQTKACGFATSLKINKEEGYTCYNESGKYLIIMIEKPYNADFDLVGINVQVSGEGRKKVHTIRSGTSQEKIFMLNETGQWTRNIKLPQTGEALTYKIPVNFTVSQVGVAPIVLYGKAEYVCSMITEDIGPCGLGGGGSGGGGIGGGSGGYIDI